LKILYFAWLRERIGTAQEELDVPASVQSVDDLITWLMARGTRHAAAFADRGCVRCAVDQAFVGADAPLGAAREVAFFPPVTGG